MNVTFEEAAALYLRHRWPVFPVSQDKRPMTSHGYKDASIDPRVIADWSSRFPEANIAIATGRASGLTVLDIDGEEGYESLENLRSQGIVFPKGPVVKTRRGEHLYMRHDRHMRCSIGKLGPGLDIRADGGSITAPPSVHKSGFVYHWVDGPDGQLPNFPLAALIILYKPQVRINRAPVHISDLREICDRAAGAQPGQRNRELNVASFMAGKLVRAGRATEEEAEKALVEAAMSAGLDRHEAVATVRSGLRGGMEA